jgi:tetratricopeptide (TPR) repeat protein
MARFDHLELEPRRDEPGDQNRKEPAEHDEKHWLRLADRNRREGFYENALRFYSRALELDKSLVVGWVSQVQMLIFLGEYPEAELWARKALEVFRNNSELLAGRAQAAFRLGDAKAAQELCDAALRQEGQSTYRWMVRGEMLVRDPQGIDRHCFEKAVQLDHDWLVPLEIALIYLHYKQPSKGLARARQAADKAPDSHYCWFVQASCEMGQGRDAAARQSLKRCLEISPNHADAKRRLAELDNGGSSLGRGLRRLFGGS